MCIPSTYIHFVQENKSECDIIKYISIFINRYKVMSSLPELYLDIVDRLKHTYPIDDKL